MDGLEFRRVRQNLDDDNYILTKIGRWTIKALIGTGAHHSCVSLSFIRRIRKQKLIVNSASQRRLFSANGNKRIMRVQPLNHRLCVPKKYPQSLLQTFYDNLGHYATRRLYLSVSQRLFWQNLYPDIQTYVDSCDTCQRSKINYKKRTSPLNPLAPETTPFLSLIHI